MNILLGLFLGDALLRGNRSVEILISLDAKANQLLLADAALEVNEKWRCPSDSVILALRNLGVRIVAGSDSHKSDDVGVYSRVLCSDLELVSSDEM